MRATCAGRFPAVVAAVSTAGAWLLLLLLLASPAAAQYPAEVRGRVTERGTGAAVPGARVEAEGAAAVAGPDGAFLLRGVTPGTREVRVTALGFREGRFSVEAANGRTATLLVVLDPSAIALEAIRVRAARDPAGATVLDRASIEASGARELGEVLRDQAGVVVTRQGGPGSPTRVSIRGSSANEVLVLLDGVPLNSALTGDADLSTVPLEAVERVTVLRGAQSARYGPRALAGVVAVETRRPRGTELSARAAAGSWGERRGALSVGGRRGAGTAALSGFASLEGQRSEGDFRYLVPGFRGGGTAVRRNADAGSLSLLASGRAERAGREVGVRVDGFTTRRGMPGGTAQPELGARQEQDRAGAALSARLPAAGVEWRMDADAQLQHARFRDPEPNVGGAYDDEVRARAAGAALSARAGRGALDVVGGAEARRLGITTSLLEDAPDLQMLGAVWLQGRWGRALGAGWTLDLLPAARADWSTRVSGATLSPRMGASATRGTLAARLSVGNAFSPPTLADQFFHEGVLVKPNPHLRPERVRGEVEGALELRDAAVGALRVDAELAAYRADVDGMVLWFPDHRFQWSPRNYDVRRAGADLQARVRFPWAEAELRGTASRAAVEYTGAVLRGQVAFRPRHTASAAASVRLPGTIRAELQGRWVGERRSVAGDTLNLLEPYLMADLRLARPFAPGAWAGEATFAIENLADTRAAMLVDYPYPGRAWTLGVRLRRGARHTSPSSGSTDR
jgi:outer membrane receptor protein involved in Fe transport